MLRVELRQAQAGMRLALPVVHPQRRDVTLLKVEYPLSGAVIARMLELGVRHVWVRYPSLSFLEATIDPVLVEQQHAVLEQVTHCFELTQQETSARLRFDLYRRTLLQLIDRLVSSPKAAVFLGDMAQSDRDLMRHSATVTYLSLLMGLKLEGYLVRERPHIDPARAAEVINLGLGAMLHDLGVTRLPTEVVEAYKRTGDESEPHWRQHPLLGYQLVRGSVEPSAATVVLNHHQRYDGTGYAGQGIPVLRDKRIHVFARIVGLAEQFDRLRFPLGLPPQPVVWALRALLARPMAKQFDAQALRALFSVVPPYAPGSVVRLSDGRWAVVVEHKTHEPCRPIVQTIPHPAVLRENDQPGETVDLTQCDKELFVALHEGVNVSDLNFDPPLAMKRHLMLAGS